MTLERSIEWWMKKADSEDGFDVSAGVPIEQHYLAVIYCFPDTDTRQKFRAEHVMPLYPDQVGAVYEATKWDDLAEAISPNDRSTDEQNLRLLVGRLCRKLPKDNEVRNQAEDYLKRTAKPQDILR
jgi:hypothetical protein